VNLAQRLERLNKKLHTDCLVSDKTYNAAREACAGARSVGSVQVRGRERSLEVFATQPAS
jgi:class 3 adenylate cyclase